MLSKGTELPRPPPTHPEETEEELTETNDMQEDEIVTGLHRCNISVLIKLWSDHCLCALYLCNIFVNMVLTNQTSERWLRWQHTLLGETRCAREGRWRICTYKRGEHREWIGWGRGGWRRRAAARGWRRRSRRLQGLYIFVILKFSRILILILCWSFSCLSSWNRLLNINCRDIKPLLMKWRLWDHTRAGEISLPY